MGRPAGLTLGLPRTVRHAPEPIVAAWCGVSEPESGLVWAGARERSGFVWSGGLRASSKFSGGWTHTFKWRQHVEGDQF